tara:strand:+ start:302 stop:1009 length:708 start_codon:yes stop_codon:yes gene_type:complete
MMKIKTIMKWYFSAITLIVTLCAAVGVAAFRDPALSDNLEHIPPWIAALFGGGLAAFAAYLVAAWKHEAEIEEKKRNIAKILCYEATNHTKEIIDHFEIYINLVEKFKNKEENVKDKIIKLHNNIFCTDINSTYRKEISIFNDCVLNNIINYFDRQKSINDSHKDIGIMNHNDYIEFSIIFSKHEIAEYIEQYFIMMKSLEIYCNESSKITKKIKEKNPLLLKEIKKHHIQYPPP